MHTSRDAVKGRRDVLKAMLALGAAAATPASAQFLAQPRFASNPFTLGVASGYPLPASVALWTRLAPQPDAHGGGMGPETVPVRWEVARDEAMKNVVASGTSHATAAWGHSVHAEAFGLEPARWYWYRFTAGDVQSPVGRTRTAPGLTRSPPAGGHACCGQRAPSSEFRTVCQPRQT